MEMILHIDFESYSRCDLKAEGLGRYAEDPSTGVHCMAFAFGGGPIELWAQERLFDLADVFTHVESGGLVYAHNAAFELAVWNQIMVPRYGWPVLKVDQVRCTMAMCYAMGLPGSLEAAAPALGIEQRKDGKGKRIMLKWCRPKADGTMWKPEDNPEEFKALCDYCRQDVEVERAMHGRLVELSSYEQKVWQLDYKINQTGVLVDLPSIRKACALAYSERARLDKEMLRATAGAIGSCSEVQTMVKWIRAQGVEIDGVAKSDVLDALSDEGLPEHVRRVLHIRQEAAKSSTAKLTAMEERACADGRIRGIHQYHGAGTGRWAGRGVQMQNLPRSRPTTSPKDVEDIIAHLEEPAYLDVMHGPALDALADSIRGMIVAPEGYDLLAVDFSAIEARVLAWLAGEESVLDIFRTHGKIYEHAAAGIYHVPMAEVTKAQRQIGKVAVLALGYGGGVGAFQSMAKNYNVKVKDAEADEIKGAWREAHPRIVNYWYRIEEAALCALQTGSKAEAGPNGRQVTFKKAGSFLWCKLPSGRCLCYPYPEIRTVTTPWGAEKDALTYMTMTDPARKQKLLPDDNASGKWQRISTYGGSLAENVTQAVARDLLADAMLRFDAMGARVTLHVHDELVIEVPSGKKPGLLKQVEQLMAEAPAWAKGLPLSAEGWRGPRYRK